MIKIFFQYLSITLILVFFTLSSASDKQEQRAVKREIKQLTRNVETAKEKSEKIRAEIKEMEQKLGNIAKKKYQTEKKIKVISKKLQAAIEKKQNLQKELNTQKEALAQQLQALQLAGQQSPLRLLLKQDNPSEMARVMKYYEYLNNSRIKKIKKTQNIYKKLHNTEQNIHKERIHLQNLTKELEAQENGIKQLLSKRSKHLKKLNSHISNQEKRLSRLLAQEEQLQTVVNQVADIKNTKTKDRSIESEEVSSNQTKIIKGKIVKTHQVANKPLSKLKGKLSWPINGKIIHNYGSKRNGQQKWKAVVLAAPGGTKVRAIAKGEVVFADWMDGYGYLIIIQHDKSYLSLYGYNRSIYKKEGEQVEANEVIAAVGNSGGQSQNALYFEIRKGRQPQDPNRWCTNKK